MAAENRLKNQATMLLFIQKIVEVFGLDKAIFFKALGLILSFLSGFFTLFLISVKFSTDEQGVYYTFSSIAALQIFFELGLNYVLVQFIAHEFAHLSINSKNIVGDEYHLSRLSSIFKLFLKWFSVSAILLWLALIAIGFIFFGFYNKNNEISWQRPWVLLSFATALFFWINMFLSCIEGIGHVRQVEKVRMLSQVIALPLVLFCLTFGYGLYALGVGILARSLVFIMFVKYSYWHIFWQLKKKKITIYVSFFKEIFPFQWKIAIGWFCAYFIYNLFTPLLFAYEGANVAGQMGMTLTVLTMISNFSFCWINTKTPRFAMMISRKEYNELDSLFNRTIKQEIGIVILGVILFLAMITILAYSNLSFNGIPVIQRFLPWQPLAFMCIANIANLFIFSFATYLRSHKKEPLFLLTVIEGMACALSAIFITKIWGIIGMTASYCIIVIVSNLIAYKIFIDKKKEWHHARF